MSDWPGIVLLAAWLYCIEHILCFIVGVFKGVQSVDKEKEK